MRADLKSAKKYSQAASIFCAFGISLHVKATHKMLVKLTLGVQKILLPSFSNFLLRGRS